MPVAAKPAHSPLLVGVIAPAVLGLFVAAGIIGAALVRSGPGNKGSSPAPSELAALVPDPGQRLALSTFYRDLAAAVRVPEGLQTAEQFRAAQSVAVQVLEAAGSMSVPASLNQPISRRLETAIGLDPGPLDAARRSALAGCLDKISKELAQ